MIERFTILCTNKYTMEKIGISTRIPQDLPMSSILFLFYNMRLLKTLEKIRLVSATSFVDNVVLLVEGKTCKENCIIFYNLFEIICKPWVLHHGSKFAIKKYQLSHITRKKNINLETPLFLAVDQTIIPPKIVTYLGILLNSKLS